MRKNILTGTGITIVVSVAIIIAETFYFFSQTKELPICTQEAKICPDGLTAGRLGPNCEFETCPKKDSTGSVLDGD